MANRLRTLANVGETTGYPYVVCNNKRNANGLACGCLTALKCFVAWDCMNSLDLFSEKREVVSTIVKVLNEFIGA